MAVKTPQNRAYAEAMTANSIHDERTKSPIFMNEDMSVLT
jgi:hypothetical protein